MSVKGGVFDASGQPISSVRIVTDVDALAGLGTSTYPIRTDPVGMTVQPVSIASGSVSITGPATVTANQGTAGGTAWPVSVASVPLPAGAALDSSLATLHADLATLDTDLKSTQPRNVTGTVSVSNFPVTQPVSGTVSANAGTNLNTSLLALEAGGNLASIKADVDKIPSQGQALAAASMPVVLPATQIATLTPPTSVGVNNFPATQPVSTASLPLPANAAQETSGNLATLVLQTRNDAQIIDILNAILGQLKLLNLNLASAMPSAHVDSDTWVMDTLPTLQ